MPQTIKCTECGAVMKTANPVAPGKKVKCPKCGKPFTVAAEEEENPFALGDSPAGKTPASKGDASGDGDKKEPAKKGKGMMIGLLAGGVLLLCCCCPGLGGGGYFVWDKFLSGPNIQGHWAAGFDQVRFMSGGKAWVFNIEDVAKGKLDPTVANAKYTIDGKTLDITLDDAKSEMPWAKANRAQFTFEIKGDELTLTNTKGGAKTTFKKVDLEKVKIGK